MTDRLTDTATPPRALILCADGRLSRLLETELAYMGVTAQAAESLPPPDGDICLLLADGDGFPVADCVSLASSRGCPLLVFGREPAALSLPSEQGVFLRRPFALTELSSVIRGLLAGLSAVGALSGLPRAHSVPEKPPEAKPSPAELTAENGTITAGGKTVPLTPAERSLFEYLYTHRGEAIPRETLSSLLSGGGNSVDVYICRLRTKIEKPLGRRMIHTVRGVGYRMDL